MGDVQKVAGSEVSPPCGALWRLVAAVNPCIASQQSPGVAVKPVTHLYTHEYLRRTKASVPYTARPPLCDGVGSSGGSKHPSESVIFSSNYFFMYGVGFRLRFYALVFRVRFEDWF